MNWIRNAIGNFICPGLMPYLDACNKKNLEAYYKTQNDFHQEQRISQDSLRNWLENGAKEMKKSDEHHKEKMEKFERIIAALESKRVIKRSQSLLLNTCQNLSLI